MTEVNIGLGQASRLSQMPYTKRLEFIAEGLPIVFESANSFLKASNALTDHARESDVLVGYAEYIFPNDELFSRESKLYADIGAHEDDELFWNVPKGFPRPRLRFDPPAYRAVEALDAVGVFSAKGIAVVADVWGQKDFRDTQSSNDSRHLAEKMLEQLI